MREWSCSCLRSLQISVDLDGVDKVPSGGFVYASNHQSLLDTLLLGATLPGDVKWAVKDSLMRIPFLGWHLWVGGHVRVDRSGDTCATQATIHRFTKVLGQGKPLLVFPEGTRSEDGRVKAFKKGPFYAAVRAGVPVVPVALHGTGAVMPKGAAGMRPLGGDQRGLRRVHVRIGEPVAPVQDKSESKCAADLCDRTRSTVIEMHRALSGVPRRDLPPGAR